MSKHEENIEKLKNEVDSFLCYKGDDELISSCNAEYTLEHNDFFITDGMANTSMMISSCYPDGLNHPITAYNFVNQHLCVRNASYLFICSIDENHKLDISLRVDEPYIDTKMDEILGKIKFIKDNYYSMKYYMYEWRGTNSVMENGTKLEDILL